MYTVSTRLAKSVFNIGDFFYKDSPTESVKIENGIITYTVGKSSFDKPVDSFFFICKSYAFKQEYKIITETRDYGTEYVIINKEDSIFGNYENLNSYYADSEQQAVFDACMYILEQSKQ